MIPPALRKQRLRIALKAPPVSLFDFDTYGLNVPSASGLKVCERYGLKVPLIERRRPASGLKVCERYALLDRLEPEMLGERAEKTEKVKPHG